MVLSEIDRNLLERCLAREAGSWEDFVDRFIGLVIHVINHTAQTRSVTLSNEDREDLAAEVFLAIVNDDFAILRRFRGDSSLATYLTVLARRVVVRHMLKQKPAAALGNETGQTDPRDGGPNPEEALGDREDVERLLGGLSGDEADVVRLFHLENKSYREISSQTGISENTIGSTLTRAREKMRRAATRTAPS